MLLGHYEREKKVNFSITFQENGIFLRSCFLQEVGVGRLWWCNAPILLAHKSWVFEVLYKVLFVFVLPMVHEIQGKCKTSFVLNNNTSDVRTKLLLLHIWQVKTVLLWFHKNCSSSGNNRAKFLPLLPFIHNGMLIRKRHSRSHANFLICFAIFPTTWILWHSRLWSFQRRDTKLERFWL